MNTDAKSAPGALVNQGGRTDQSVAGVFARRKRHRYAYWNSERRVKSLLLGALGMDVPALFRRRLRKMILAKYRSLDRFYLESEFSKGHLSEILRGKGSPSVTTLIKLAEALGVEIVDFFIFPEESERDRAVELLRKADSETIRRVLRDLSIK